MQIKDSRYHKVWEIQDNDNFKKIRFGDGKKDKDGVWQNCTWNGIIVGKGKDVLIQEGDVFTINSGVVFSEKYNDKWYVNVTIFDLDVTSRQEPTDEQKDYFSDFVTGDLSDEDLPF